MPLGKKRGIVHVYKERNPELCGNTVRGFFFSFYGGKAPTRLFVVLIVPVKPFDDVVANYSTHDSSEKREEQFHVYHLLPLPGIGWTTK